MLFKQKSTCACWKINYDPVSITLQKHLPCDTPLFIFFNPETFNNILLYIRRSNIIPFTNFSFYKWHKAKFNRTTERYCLNWKEIAPVETTLWDKTGKLSYKEKGKKKKKELLITFFNIASRGTFIQCQNRGAISGADETFRHFRLTHVTIGTEKREKSDKYERKRERSCSVYAIFDHHHKI